MRLLDLFCGAGGAAVGYYRAGFTDIVGVDNRPQKHYPFRFVLADALEYVAEHGREFDMIHASPPCQAYSVMRNLPWLANNEYPALIAPVRDLLIATGRPYVIENVKGARHGSRMLSKHGLEAHGLQAGWLCGAMFGLRFYQHRYFETTFYWLQPAHTKHQTINAGRMLGSRQRDTAERKGIDWMTVDELSQAIPPSYTEWIGREMLRALEY